jgi:hypothetical protein
MDLEGPLEARTRPSVRAFLCFIGSAVWRERGTEAPRFLRKTTELS